MAIDINDMRMPQTIDIGDFSGGYDYQYYRGDGSASNTHWYSLGTVNEVDVSALLGPPSQGVQTEAEAEIITFPNGYKYCLLFKYSFSGSNVAILTTRKIYDNNGNLLPSDPVIPDVTFYGGSSMLVWTNIAYAYPFAQYKVCLLARYYPQIKDSTAPPTDFAFVSFFSNGVTAAQYDEGGNQLPNIVDGAEINEYYDIQRYNGNLQHNIGSTTLIKFTGNGINNFNDWLKNNGDPFPGDGVKPSGGGGGTPAGEDDTSEPGGGGGNYDDTSDPVDFPDLPTGGAIESGAVIAHRVSKQTLEVIFTKLWNKNLIDITNVWQKSIQDPMDAIVSLHALPVSPEVAADPDNIAVGNLDMGVTSPLVTSQYVEVDCGTLNVREFWGSALDYSPYTKVEIFLPFIGMKTLRTEDVMKSTLHIKYYVDVLSGDCIAFIKCGISVLYTYNGNCKMLIPLSSRSTDFLQKAAVAAGLAVGAAGVAVGGGAAAAAATKAPAVAAAGVTQSAANLQAGSMLLSGASNVASTKINTQRSGDISSALSLMADFVPYLIIHRPVQSLAKDYNKFKGYTSNITARLGDLTGYTEVEHVHLQNIPNATDAELAEIHSLLVGGVII